MSGQKYNSNLDEDLRKLKENLNRQSVENQIEMVELGFFSLTDEFFRALKKRTEWDSDEEFLPWNAEVERTIRKVDVLHQGQKRKGPGRQIPALSHLLGVAEIVASYHADLPTIQAALLHDSLEDTEYTYALLKNEFGDKVAKIVLSVSEDPKLAKNLSATWLERKKSYLENLKKGSAEAMMVCATDKIHNLSSLQEMYKKFREKTWEYFNSTPKQRIWFYDEVLKIVKSRLTHPVVERFEKELEKAKREMFS